MSPTGFMHSAGPLLFILYINDLPNYNLDINTDISLFADDSKISTVLSDVSERSTMRQERLNQFMEWADRWQLKIAEYKCCVLTHGTNIPPTYNLTKWCSTTKCQGIP